MTMLPGYRDLTALGRGGYSEVYRGYQVQFDRWVAVKLLTFTLTDDRSQQRFLRECRVAGRVSAHPNIVTVYDAGLSPDGRPYMAMELYDMGSIADRLRSSGPFPVDETLRIAVHLAGALESAHRSGVVHRDVKPGNVMLATYGQPALTDFGLSIVAERQEVSTGVDALSPHYAPPEILEDSGPTPASDVYSLASTVYAMLAGRAPHQRPGGSDDSLGALLRRIVHDDAPPLDRSDIPPSLDAVLHAALARDPQRRTPTALELAQALQGIQAELGLEVTQPVVLEAPPSATPEEPPYPPDPPVVLDTPPQGVAVVPAGSPPPPPPPPPVPTGAAGGGDGAADVPPPPPGPPPPLPEPTVVQGAVADDGTEAVMPGAEAVMPGRDSIAGYPPGPPLAGSPGTPASWAAGADAAPPAGDQTMFRSAVASQAPPPLVDPSQPKRPSRAPLVVLVILLVAAAIAGGAFAVTRDDDETAGGNGGGSGGNGSSTTTTEDSTTTTEGGGNGGGGGSSTTTTEETTTTTAEAPPQAQDLPVADVSAPSAAPDGFDACQTPTSFGATNVVDGASNTAWRMEGDGSGQTLTITLDAEHRILTVGLVPGYAKVDPCDGTDRFAQNRRPTAVTWTFDDGSSVEQPLDDRPEMQTVEVDANTTTIQLRIDGVTGNPARDFTAISELTVRGA